jgi:hypothetical protein
MLVYATWHGSTDNYDAPADITYEFYNTSTGALVHKVKGKTKLTGYLNNCTTYVVRARDRSGNLSGPSNLARTSWQDCG